MQWMRWVFVSLLLIIGFIGLSQPVTVEKIDSALSSLNKDYKTKRGVVYMIDGVLYDSLSVDSVLRRHDLADLLALHFLSCDKTNFCDCRSDIAVISFVYDQKNKVKLKEWKEAGELFNGCLFPDVYINNKRIESTSAYEVFRSLRLKNIRYIEADETLYPQLRVWLSKK